jgi:hypothetical protein
MAYGIVLEWWIYSVVKVLVEFHGGWIDWLIKV